MCGHLKYGRTVNRSSALKKRAANEWCKESGIVTGVKAEEEGFFFCGGGSSGFQLVGGFGLLDPLPQGQSAPVGGWAERKFLDLVPIGAGFGVVGWVGRPSLAPPPPGSTK